MQHPDIVITRDDVLALPLSEDRSDDTPGEGVEWVLLPVIERQAGPDHPTGRLVWVGVPAGLALAERNTMEKAFRFSGEWILLDSDQCRLAEQAAIWKAVRASATEATRRAKSVTTSVVIVPPGAVPTDFAALAQAARTITYTRTATPRRMFNETRPDTCEVTFVMSDGRPMSFAVDPDCNPREHLILGERIS